MAEFTLKLFLWASPAVPEGSERHERPRAPCFSERKAGESGRRPSPHAIAELSATTTRPHDACRSGDGPIAESMRRACPDRESPGIVLLVIAGSSEPSSALGVETACRARCVAHGESGRSDTGLVRLSASVQAVRVGILSNAPYPIAKIRRRSGESFSTSLRSL